MKVGIADTTFSRFNFAEEAIAEIRENTTGIIFERYTVPGIKDLPVACKKLLDERGCSAVMAFGMPGKEDIDKICAHEASQGIIQVQLMTNKHVLEVFVYEDEVEDEKILLRLCKNRSRKHAHNLINLLKYPEKLTKNAGTGQREGSANVSPLKK
jgi:riboflavin synthase|tara:strand:- start:8311 stop:8775 length:465 start_codon:yes stop_codon:yes gene_type:complete